MAAIQKISHPQGRTKRNKSSNNRSVFIVTLMALLALAITAFVLLTQVTSTSSSTSSSNSIRGADIDTVDSSNISKEEDAEEDTGADADAEQKPTVTLVTSQGDILIHLRPDLAPESVQYVQALIQSDAPCKKCRFYRAEQRGILQGVLVKDGIPPNETLGKCPLTSDELQEFHKKVAEEDESGKAKPPACHGPLMTRGMVGWAAGEGGPDFFIDFYKRPANWWGRDHTVWGMVDEKDWDVVESFFDLPAHRDGLVFLDEPVSIDLK
jgi:cyclophilin family peptidyl-prolyl cis-trans isomerase